MFLPIIFVCCHLYYCHMLLTYAPFLDSTWLHFWTSCSAKKIWPEPVENSYTSCSAKNKIMLCLIKICAQHYRGCSCYICLASYSIGQFVPLRWVCSGVRQRSEESGTKLCNASVMHKFNNCRPTSREQIAL